MQIDGKFSGSFDLPKPTNKKDMGLTGKVMDPSGVEEETSMQLGAGGEKKRMVFDLNVVPEEKYAGFDLNVEPEEEFTGFDLNVNINEITADEDVVWVHSSEENVEDEEMLGNESLIQELNCEAEIVLRNDSSEQDVNGEAADVFGNHSSEQEVDSEATDVLGNHSSEKEDNGEAAYCYKIHEERIPALFLENKPTCNDKQATETTQLQKDLTNLLNYWLSKIGEIQKLEDESDQEHAVQCIGLFLNEIAKCIQELSSPATEALKSFFIEDFYVLHDRMESANIRMMEFMSTCTRFFKENDPRKCGECLDQLKQEYLQVKTKLETFLEIK